MRAGLAGVGWIKQRSTGSLAALLAALFFAGPVRASQLIPRSLPELAAGSDQTGSQA